MKSKYITSAFWLIFSSLIVKIIGAFYKIPLTAYIGAVGRGYLATAYNLYLPFHAVVMGAFPIAMSRLISKYKAEDNPAMIDSLKKGSLSLFHKTGLVAFIILLLLAKPYCVFVASSPKSVYSALVLAPSILFSCLASSYRGYFEGMLNMKPTAVSQMLEAVFKLVFGLLFARATMARLYSAYLETGIVLGNKVNGESEALLLIYPCSSCASMLGVTLGTLISLFYVFVYYKINAEKTTLAGNKKEGRKELLAFSIPIMLSSAIQSVFQFLDTASVQWAISKVDKTYLYNTFSLSETKGEDIFSYVYGIFSTALDFKNLIPGITMALGVTAVPALCRVYEQKDYEKFSRLMNSVFKYTSLLSVFAGVFIYLCSEDILSLFYSNSSPDIVTYSSDITKYFALTGIFYSLASTAVFCVQALGIPERSVKSYIFSGIIRIVLNVILISDKKLLLNGAVISGAVGYFVLYLINKRIVLSFSNSKNDVINSLLKPILIGIITLFLCKYLIFTQIYKNILIVNLLIKFGVFAVLFCILCLLLKTVNFDEKNFSPKFKKNGLNT